MKKFSAKRIAVLGVLLAAASIVFIVESLIPPLLPFAPYVKVGLANCFVLFVIIYFGFAEGVVFLLVKNAISALWSFSVVVFAFNVAGSFAAFFVMYLLYRVAFPRISVVAISVAGAVFSNIARTSLAALVMETPSLYVQLPFVCAFSVLAGILVGILTVLSVKHLPERLTKFK